MRIYVNVKKMGKRKNTITKIPYDLSDTPKTVQEFLVQMVKICVQDYNARKESKELLQNLSLENMENQAVSGKISFGINYGENTADEEKAVENAIQCFKDGIYRIFYHTEELKDLEQAISIKEESEFTFVRLTMLSGRMW